MFWCYCLHKDIALLRDNQIVRCHGSTVSPLSCFDRLSDHNLVTCLHQTVTELVEATVPIVVRMTSSS